MSLIDRSPQNGHIVNNVCKWSNSLCLRLKSGASKGPSRTTLPCAWMVRNPGAQLAEMLRHDTLSPRAYKQLMLVGQAAGHTGQTAACDCDRPSSMLHINEA